jgi:hypothetical protein
MDTKAVIVLSTWLAVTVIAAVYMLVFSNKIGDVMFGVFLPVGLLVIVALVVTFTVLPNQQPK